MEVFFLLISAPKVHQDDSECAGCLSSPNFLKKYLLGQTFQTPVPNLTKTFNYKTVEESFKRLSTGHKGGFERC